MTILSKLKTGLFATLIGSSISSCSVLRSKISNYEDKRLISKVHNYANSFEKMYGVELGSLNISFSFDTFPFAGSYTPYTDSIQFYPGVTSQLKSSIHTLKTLSFHEFGHKYMFDIISTMDSSSIHKSHNLNNYVGLTFYSDKPYSYDTLSRNLLSEGVASYFEEGANSKTLYPLITEQFPKELLLDTLSSDSDFHYRYGKTIVAPILDSLGLEEGIRRIYSNPLMKPEELLDVESYQQRILDNY